MTVAGALILLFLVLVWGGWWLERQHPGPTRVWRGVPVWLWVAFAGGLVLFMVALIPQVQMGLSRR